MNNNQRDNNQNQNNNAGWFAAAGAVATGVLAVAGGIYLASGSKKQPETPQGNKLQSKPKIKLTVPNPEAISRTFSGLSNMLNSLLPSSEQRFYTNGKVAKNPPPENPCLSNLNALLADIHIRYIQLKNDDFRLHYNVFDKLFQHLHERMMEVDPYYRKYNSTRQFAGSHYDNLRIKKPDEFDMDIVIRLPLNISESPARDQSDIVIEPKAAGFVHLRMGTQFQKLPMRDKEEWETNKTAYKWMDEKTKYLQRSKFMDWWKGVVNRALNTFQMRDGVPIFYIDGVEYKIDKSESGPAMTLFIKNDRRGFKLDVDLVPALKFPETRWPITSYYRHIPPGCCKNTWMVVGKPDKGASKVEQERSWRIALHNQERELMHNTYHLRQAIRLLKKLRDELGMKKIASYYIKVLFFWEIIDQEKEFWRNNPAYLFKYMVKKLHTALVNGSIPYFWNRRNNLIENVDRGILSGYAAKLVPLMQILDSPSDYKMVAKYLLSPAEYREYNNKFLHVKD